MHQNLKFRDKNDKIGALSPDLILVKVRKSLFSTHLLPHNATIALYYAVVVCLSVRPKVHLSVQDSTVPKSLNWWGHGKKAIII